MSKDLSEWIKKLPELLTEPQTAELAGFSGRTWRRMTRSGVAPAPLRIGRGSRPMIRFRKSEILAWIENGCKPVDR